MKKVAKAMYGKTMMNDGGKVGRAERKEIRQGRRARTKELVDEGLITPFEGIKLRMQAAKEARQGQKKNNVTPKAKYGMSMKPGMMKKGGKVTAKKMEMGGMSSGTMMKDSEMKMGGAKKLKMMNGGAKPKAMYGASMKPGMMKMGGTKKK